MAGIKATLGTFNYEQGGDGDLHPLIAQIGACVPDVLFLCEATQWQTDGAAVFLRAVSELSDLLPGATRYAHYFGESRSTVLLVNPSVIEPMRWFGSTASPRLIDTLQSRVGDQAVWLGVRHWRGGAGRSYFEQQSVTTGHLYPAPAILAGDFNCTSSAPGEVLPDDWEGICRRQGNPQKLAEKAYFDHTTGRWTIDTWPLDYLRTSGWWDVGERAKDFTATVNAPTDPMLNSGLRIDRFLVSETLPCDLIPGSYKVHIPEHYRDHIPALPPGEKHRPSNHRYVTCSLTLGQ